MKQRKWIIIIVIALQFSLQAKAQGILYTSEDSTFIEQIVKKRRKAPYQETGERTIAIANEFCGKQYVAGTLDRHDGEPLFISCTEFDCTTFVELVVSLAMAENDSTFITVCRNLEKIRYRGGIRNGYTSRLHYISWWIDDPAKQDIIKEVRTSHHSAEQILKLNFMSRHPENYPSLRNNHARRAIAVYEKRASGRKITYIPKDAVAELDDEEIRNGDIIAIVTQIEGLDVSHVGFAYWIDGTLHMIHASSGKKTVICDPLPLHEYIMRNSSSLGIRIFRVYDNRHVTPSKNRPKT